MIVQKIKLTNFRCYETIELEFKPGINYIYGDNASGKTSLVEAIYYLSLARSFRTIKDKELINKNNDSAIINASLKYIDSNKEIIISLMNNGKKIFVNKKQINKISELSNLVNAICFVPKDVNLLKESPSQRRLFLNLSIAKVSKKYLELCINYEKILHSRNELLKEEVINFDLFDVLTSQLISISKEIYFFRKKYIDNLNNKINFIYKSITGKDETIKVIYESFISNYENYEVIADKKYKESKEIDLLKKVTNIGVHKEDFKILLNSKDVSKYGSQGENRLSVLSLKLTPYELIEEDDKKPIIILDDVLSELDKTNQENLLKYLTNLNQVFITSTNKITNENINYYFINKTNIEKGE